MTRKQAFKLMMISGRFRKGVKQLGPFEVPSKYLVANAIREFGGDERLCEMFERGNYENRATSKRRHDNDSGASIPGVVVNNTNRM